MPLDSICGINLAQTSWSPSCSNVPIEVIVAIGPYFLTDAGIIALALATALFLPLDTISSRVCNCLIVHSFTIEGEKFHYLKTLLLLSGNIFSPFQSSHSPSLQDGQQGRLFLQALFCRLS